jgi:tetratricopeptide (TPR) repeat protein
VANNLHRRISFGLFTFDDVTGELRREGEALRITGSVVDAARETPIARLDEVMERRGLSLPNEESQASIRVARTIATHLVTSEPDTTPRATADPAAWEAFMEATASIHKGTVVDVRHAIEQLEEAVTRDSQFAAAWARLAEAHHLLVMMGAAAPRVAYPMAQTAATRAITAAPNLPSAHLAQGLVQLWFDWRPVDAAASFERALALNPSLAAAHHDYAWALVALGRTNDAIRHITLARDLDPISTRANNDMGWLYLFIRQPQEAARACQHTLALDARSLEAQACLERAYADRQLYDAALQAARATLAASEDVPALLSGVEGLRELWRWRLRQLERAADTRWVNPYTLAVHYVLTNDHARALQALDDAYAKRVGMLAFLARDPAMDPLRTAPRFDALLEKVTQTTR